MKDALDLADNIDYPVILKAAKGGGGRGLRIVTTADELKVAFNSSRNEAMMSFGSEGCILKNILRNPGT